MGYFPPPPPLGTTVADMAEAFEILCNTARGYVALRPEAMVTLTTTGGGVDRTPPRNPNAPRRVYSCRSCGASDWLADGRCSYCLTLHA